MAKLTRNTKTPRPSATDKAAASSRQGNPTLMIGVILAVGVAILFYVFFSSLQAKQTIMVASTNIPAFSSIQSNQLQKVSVPKDSVSDTDLTAATYESMQKDGESIVNRVEILQGQRVSNKAIGKSSLGALSVVKNDEEVVAVSTSLTGIAGGVIVPGAVVSVYSTSGGDGNVALVNQAKVLAVGTGPQVADSVQPSSKVKGGSSSNGGIIVILAVKNADAGKLLGQSQVALAYNPHKSFNSSGDICNIDQCANKASDAAAAQPSGATTNDPTVSGN